MKMSHDPSFRFELKSEDLPSSFNHVIVDSNNDSEFHVRCNIFNMEEIQQWVQEFSYITKTQWNSRHSVPNGKQMVCMKQFVCHHAAFMKVDRHSNIYGPAVSKNAFCTAKLTIKIKLTTTDTIKRDQYTKMGLPAIIRISKQHTHKLETAQSYRFLQDREGTLRQKFLGYFNERMNAAEAKTYHEGFLEEMNTSEADFANGFINPSKNTVSHWYSQWREENLGPRGGPGVIQKLREKIAAYNEEGITIVFREDPFCVFILTPIMSRAHDLVSDGEIAFSDTTSSCDPEHHSVTFLLTTCSAGAAPLGVLITKGQSMEAYKAGFELAKSTLLDNGFSGKLSPTVFMTDNSSAEIEALKSVWPDSINLLCTFHVLQAIWRWLWDSKNGIEHDDRPILMRSFQKILRSDSLNDVETLYADLVQSGSPYPQWTKYISQTYWPIKEKWCMAYRTASVRNNHTNNYAEASVRLFKDLVLSRVQAYNVISLVDFCCTALAVNT